MGFFFELILQYTKLRKVVNKIRLEIKRLLKEEENRGTLKNAGGITIGFNRKKNWCFDKTPHLTIFPYKFGTRVFWWRSWLSLSIVYRNTRALSNLRRSF